MPRKLALLIGVGDNAIPANILPGPPNDVAVLRDLLVAKYGFAADDVRDLQDAAATHVGIVRAFEEHLIGKARRGDLVFFYFSGHGVLVPEQVKGSEATGYDTALCPYDAKSPDGKTAVNVLRDNELAGLLRRVPTPHVWVMVDACHSGTASRAGLLPRRTTMSRLYLSPRGKAQEPPPASPPSIGIRSFGGANGREIYLGAATDDQEAMDDAFLPSATNPNMGAFTFYVTETLRGDADNRLPVTGVRNLVAARLRERYGDQSQTPQAYGQDADRLPFLCLPGEAVPPGSAPADPTAAPALFPAAEVITSVAENGAGGVRLRAIAGSRLTPGSLLVSAAGRGWRVRRTGTAVVRVEAARGDQFAGSLLHGTVTVGTRLAFLYAAPDAEPLRITLTGAGVTQTLRTQIAGVEDVVLVSPGDARDWEFAVPIGGGAATPFRGNTPLPKVPVTRIVPLAHSLAATKRLAGLENRAATLGVRLSADGKAGFADAIVGDALALVVQADADVYVYLLSVEADGALSGVDAGRTRRDAPLRLSPTVTAPAGIVTVIALVSETPLTLSLPVKPDPNAPGAVRRLLDELRPQLSAKPRWGAARLLLRVREKGTVP